MKKRNKTKLYEILFLTNHRAHRVAFNENYPLSKQNIKDPDY
jgi:hypothetical protein